MLRVIGFKILLLLGYLRRPFITVRRMIRLRQGSRLQPVDQVRGQGVHPDCADEPVLRCHVGSIVSVSALFQTHLEPNTFMITVGAGAQVKCTTEYNW